MHYLTVLRSSALSRALTLALTHVALSTAMAQTDTSVVRAIDVQPVVVATSRAAEADPVTATTIDSAQLRAVVVGQDLPFVLQSASPSLLAYSESGTNFSNYGTFRLRGIDQTRVNVTFNGAPLNDMIDQGVFFSNLTDLANGTTSVQVQRGVGVAQNGTASFAGSVNLQTASLASAAPGGRLQLSSGSFGLLRGSFEATTGLTDQNISVMAKLTSFRTDGYRNYTGTRSFSGQVGAAWFGAQDVVRLNVLAGRTDNQLGYIPVPKPLADLDPRTNVNDSTDYDDFGQALIQLDWSRQLSPTAALGVMTYYGTAGGDFYSGFRDENNTLTQINYPLENRHLGAMASVQIDEVAPGLDLSVGAHGYRFWRRNWEAVSPDMGSPYYDDRTVKDELSGVAKVTYRRGAIELLGNVQVRSVSMTFSPDAAMAAVLPVHSWLFVNPFVGITYHLADQHSLYGSVGRTGREPTRFDLLGGTTINEANIFVLQTPNTVRPEYVVDMELGYRLHTDEIDLDVNGFMMQFTDEIAPIGRYIDQWFVQLRENVSRSSRWGAEFQATWRPAHNLSVHGTATWMQTNIEAYTPADLGVTYADVEAVLSPRVLGSIWVEYQPVDLLGVRAAMRHAGKSWLDLANTPSLTLDGFTVVDLAATLHVQRHRLTIQANNILSEAYAVNGAVTTFNTATVPALFMQAPLNVVVMLEVSL